MRFASIGSGSEGNGLVVEAGTTRILIDCGFGVRDTAARLARIGVAPEVIRRTLDGRLKVAPDGATRSDPNYLIIGRDGAGRPRAPRPRPPPASRGPEGGRGHAGR